MDREKVIEGLECCVKGNACNKCDYKESGICCVTNLAHDALELLREQEPIVRCKDCKHRFNGRCYDRKSDRINFGVYVAGDWFCADGERQEGQR